MFDCHYCKDTGWIREENGHVTPNGYPQMVSDTCSCEIGRKIDADNAKPRKSSAQLLDEADDAWRARNDNGGYEK